MTQHRWHDILTRLGIQKESLTGKHKPCPKCGGHDRFRFDDLEGKGTWICNKCGAGDGFGLLKLVHGWDFDKALEEVRRVSPDAEVKKSYQPDNENILLKLKALSKRCEDFKDSPVADYLVDRGISLQTLAAVKNISYVRDLEYYKDGKLKARMPAMVSRMQCGNKPVSLHRTYIYYKKNHQEWANKKMIMPPVGTINGSAVQLFKPTDTLGLCEGIETAMACYQLFGVPTWACATAQGLEKFMPPKGLKIVIFGDNDLSYTGHAAAYNLARRLVKDGYEVKVKVPDQIGWDYLDVLNKFTVGCRNGIRR